MTTLDTTASDAGPLPEAPPAPAEPDAPPAVLAWSHASRITFASHQADVPLVTELVVRSASDAPLENLRLTLSAAPPIFRARTWPIDRLGPGDELRITDRRLEVDGALLAELDERMRADLRLELAQGERILASATGVVTALARSEWGGARYMPELLGAFVLPNDPGTATVLKEASRALEANGRRSSLEGYQSKERKRVWEMVEAMWAAVAARRLTYTSPPASFETEGQKVRSPLDVLETGLATCLDLALLFAAAAEQAGLHPLIALTEGHAFAGVWLQPQPTAGAFGLTTDDADDPVALFARSAGIGRVSAGLRAQIEVLLQEARED